MRGRGGGRVDRCRRRCVARLVFAAAICIAFPAGAQGPAQFAAARQRLIQEILIPSGIQDPRVLQSVASTPRHEFVPLPQRGMAYYDMALPIGGEQTISSPFIVAFMTQSLDPQPEDRVLEIGTGSGYQAAILSPLVKDVFTIEIVEPLGRRAERLLKRLKYGNVHVKIGDGFQGWPEHAPFDKIIVTCSPEKVPQPLIDQLKEGGMIVVPVGERYQQTLVELTKQDGQLKERALRPTLFVPMTGRAEAMREVLPDADKLGLQNGSFELPLDETGHVAGWYYQRQVEQVADSEAPDGASVVKFSNQTPGRASLMLQGLALSGEVFSRLEVRAHVRYQQVVPGAEPDMRAMISVGFYDAQRRPLGQQWLGPWQGTQNWQLVEESFRVPPASREAILRVGLFGATGERARPSGKQVSTPAKTSQSDRFSRLAFF